MKHIKRETFRARAYGNGLIIQIPGMDGGAFVQGKVDVYQNDNKIDYKLTERGFGHSDFETELLHWGRNNPIIRILLEKKILAPNNTWHIEFYDGIDIEIEVELTDIKDIMMSL